MFHFSTLTVVDIFIKKLVEKPYAQKTYFSKLARLYVR